MEIGQHAELPHLFKPPRTSSKFDISQVQPFLATLQTNFLFIIHCNLMGPTKMEVAKVKISVLMTTHFLKYLWQMLDSVPPNN